MSINWGTLFGSVAQLWGYHMERDTVEVLVTSGMIVHV
jgi:hypothetical protein